jgi:hypothetical protein
MFEKEAESKAIETCPSNLDMPTYVQGFVNGAEFGYNKGKAETALLSQHILDLQKDKGNLTDRVRELEQQIEKMECCGNCRFSESDKLNGTFCHREGCFVVASAKCKLWEN